MPSHGLAPDVLLRIDIGCVISRNRYARDAAPVIAELHATAGDRVDLLAEEVGLWIGFFEDAEIITLCAALRELPGLDPWIAVGAYRRSLPDHRTPSAHAGASWPER